MDPFGGFVQRRWVWLALPAAVVAVFSVAPEVVAAYGMTPALVVLCTALAGGAVLGVRRLRVLAGNRAAAREDGFASWLPPSTDHDHDRRIDFEAETRRLRRVARRAAALVLVWVAVAGSGTLDLVLLDRAADKLLATGARTTGEVVSVQHYTRGGLTFRVRYGSRTAEIVRDSKNSYAVGERVIVVFDRADPDRVRTTEEENENPFLVNLGYVLLVAGSLGTLFAAWAAVGWRNRARAVAATGWRNATVDIVRVARHGRSVRRPPPELHVRYRDGTGIELRAVSSTHGANALAIFTDRLAWVGGWGRHMVVLFPDGPSRPGPYAVPATAMTRRTEDGVSRSRR
ncbi:DUF3592 domain-containing protein [Amycolatopsis vancoresmycina]|uniref:DUF3592 domain-containing protein n=1 Tax=Amycolatopsis vancoresmycina DSM 44592 TaxID=1292037 RepID=R1H6M7_9PSEU|nr:DUF3592 domain-containing protein [Amycolatopsis vancoresmycina]EOD59270.1 hypothetical protein H480_41840 [Amycolatopsis vancoresmycina DSM 44592]